MDTNSQEAKPFDINKMTPEQNRQLIDKMINGFALHKIVLDESGKPIDYIFLDMNPAFESKTGLKKADVLGKKVTEVLPGIVNDPENFISKYGTVALGGEPINVEVYSADLKKWYLINTYSPQKYYFVVMMNDITEHHKSVKELEQSNFEMQRLNSLMINRETKMIQLKNKLKELGVDPSTI